MRVFISGMAGTLGAALAREHADRGDTVFGCTRNEEKCIAWMQQYAEFGTMYCCDCKDLLSVGTDIGRLLPTMDRVYHCAAMKHVDLCEKNPNAAAYQNVALTGMLADYCREAEVPFIFVSSDKACLPIGVYGATKLLAEKIVVSHGGAVVRFGNLIGSSGSVFQIWNQSFKAGEPILLTDSEMTRYFLPLRQAVKFLLEEAVPGRVAVPAPLLSVRMLVVAEEYRRRGAVVKVTGKRPGETTHQWLVPPDSRVDCHMNKYLLDGATQHLLDGLCSNWGKRWDVRELLAEAGVS